MHMNSHDKSSFEYFLHSNLRSPVLLIHYLSCEFTLNFLSVTRINNWLIIFCANWLWIHYLFRQFTMDLLPFPWIDYELTFISASSLWIPLWYIIISANSLSTHYLLCECPIDPSSFPRIHYGFIIFFCEFTMISLSLSRNHYD